MTVPANPADRTDLSALEPAIALSPLDGRYRGVTAPLVNHLSEAALNRNRLHVEVEWLIHLVSTGAVPVAEQLPAETVAALRRLVVEFNGNDIAELAEIEKITVHDVKAIEYYLQNKLKQFGSEALDPAIHFGTTSEDVNNLAYALGIKDAVEQLWLPAAESLVAQISELAEANADLPMLARTHGQPATPTTLGKELGVTAFRLQRQLKRIKATEYLGKINGATGTYAAMQIAVPETDWIKVSEEFVTNLGLTWNPVTTQIESHDWQAELYADLARFNRILHNFATDIWTYISLGYFAQVRGQGTVGSSTMPHKVNPIRFENAEANLELSNALLDSLSATLVTSRLQRDLTDSSTQRNIGSAFGHALIALSNVAKGLAGLDVSPAPIARDLDDNWEVLAEAIQSVMRAESVNGQPGLENPYERLKELTRGRRISGDEVREFVQGLGLTPSGTERLSALTPAGYIGLAQKVLTYVR